MPERIQRLLERIEHTRQYTNNILDHVPEDDWYRVPDSVRTTIAWQAIHIAWAQRGLVFGRVAGMDHTTQGMFPDSLVKLAGKGTVPSLKREDYPAVTEIRGLMSAIHQEVLDVLPTINESILDDVIDPPHPCFATKEQALMWVSGHELTHAGQISLLRRLCGHEPLR